MKIWVKTRGGVVVLHIASEAEDCGFKPRSEPKVEPRQFFFYLYEKLDMKFTRVLRF